MQGFRRSSVRFGSIFGSASSFEHHADGFFSDQRTSAQVVVQ
jgi:hypothetical protein